MILFVVGGGHTAAAHAAVPFCIAEDDANRWYMGRVPHPDNEHVSFASHLQRILKARLIWEYGETNQEVFDKCYKFLTEHDTNEDVFVITGWPEDISDDNEIYEFHKELLEHNVHHLFFTEYPIEEDNDWRDHMVWESYTGMLKHARFESDDNGYFGADAHYFWANHLLKYLTKLL